MSGTSDSKGSERKLVERVITWFEEAGRPLPWRDPNCSAWGVFLSEVMSQQTPMVRVEPIWREWIERWPTPSALAAAAPGDAVRHWGRLGYPRRALRLHEAAQAMVEHHDGQVPATYDELLALPGVGDYTASAVSAFAHAAYATVIDTNIRRVEARTVTGMQFPANAVTKAERQLAQRLVDVAGDKHVRWNQASMELGALICTAKAPKCVACPVLDLCAWQLAGAPAYDGPARRGQAWAGTDRMVRGRIVQLLRDADTAVPREKIELVWDDAAQRERCLDSLISDGLVDPVDDDLFALPGHAST